MYGIYKSGKRTSVCLSRTTFMLVWTYMIYVRDTLYYALSCLLHGTLSKRNNSFTRCVFLELPFVVLTGREIVCQRCWRLSYRTRLISYRTTCRVMRKTWIRQKIHFPWQRSSSVCIIVVRSVNSTTTYKEVPVKPVSRNGCNRLVRRLAQPLTTLHQTPTPLTSVPHPWA